jgi:hypothetical protein
LAEQLPLKQLVPGSSPGRPSKFICYHTSMRFKREPKLSNKTEAAELLENEVNKRRTLSYDELLKWIEDDKKVHQELIGTSGTAYQIELYAMWDDKKAKTICFWGNIDGDSISAFRPMSSTFIKAPDGKFVGE